MRRIVLYSAILGFVLTVLIYGILVDFDLVRLVPAVVLMILASAMGGLALGATIPLVAGGTNHSSPKQSVPTTNTPVPPARHESELTLTLPFREYALLRDCLRWLVGSVTISSPDVAMTSGPAKRFDDLSERIAALQERVDEPVDQFMAAEHQDGADYLLGRYALDLTDGFRWIELHSERIQYERCQAQRGEAERILAALREDAPRLLASGSYSDFASWLEERLRWLDYMSSAVKSREDDYARNLPLYPIVRENPT